MYGKHETLHLLEAGRKVGSSPWENTITIDGETGTITLPGGDIQTQIDNAGAKLGAKVLMVSASGGQYTTIQAAIDAIPASHGVCGMPPVGA